VEEPRRLGLDEPRPGEPVEQPQGRGHGNDGADHRQVVRHEGGEHRPHESRQDGDRDRRQHDQAQERKDPDLAVEPEEAGQGVEQLLLAESRS
jgi:hypothetical protein